MSRIARALVLAAALSAAPSAAVSAQAAPPQPFGHACTARATSLLCPTATDADRVPAFDGTPLDVDVTLPSTGNGPFPTVVLIHGFGGSKTDLQATTADGGGKADLNAYNTTALAEHGYAVVTPTVRGFGRSCGAADSRTPECAQGYIRLADQRYEARDVQELVGRLVDEGVADPGRIGVSGVSYGGGISLMLGFLRDRIRRPDGSFAPWRSPRGTPLAIKAAAPVIPWSDLASALVPNGRFRDTLPPNDTNSQSPVGVPIKSYVDVLFAAAQANFLAPAGLNPEADLAGWKNRLDKGEPYGADVTSILGELFQNHSALGITSGTPAPLLISQGWTDELFPVDQALRVYNALLSKDKNALVSLHLGDFGHPKASNDPAALLERNSRILRFLDQRVNATIEVSDAPTSGVSATLTDCTASKDPTVSAASYAALHPGQVLLLGSAKVQKVRSGGGDKALAKALDPILGAANKACAQVPAPRKIASGTAVYGAKTRKGFTLAGSPAIGARVKVKGGNGQLVARLWDVDVKAKRKRLVSRGVYRLELNQNRSILFQLHANGYRVAAGHAVELELLGQDVPYYRRSNDSFSIEVSKVLLQMPTREKASKAKGITKFTPLRLGGSL